MNIMTEFTDTFTGNLYLYARVSDKAQCLEEQIAQCLAWYKRQGVDESDVIIVSEKISSRVLTERRKLWKVLHGSVGKDGSHRAPTTCKKGELLNLSKDFIIAYDLTRLTRGFHAEAMIITTIILMRTNTALYCMSEGKLICSRTDLPKTLPFHISQDMGLEQIVIAFQGWSLQRQLTLQNEKIVKALARKRSSGLKLGLPTGIICAMSRSDVWRFVRMHQNGRTYPSIRREFDNKYCIETLNRIHRLITKSSSTRTPIKDDDVRILIQDQILLRKKNNCKEWL